MSGFSICNNRGNGKHETSENKVENIHNFGVMTTMHKERKHKNLLLQDPISSFIDFVRKVFFLFFFTLVQK